MVKWAAMLPIYICQAHLDKVDDALLAGDFQRYKSFFCLPLNLLSPAGTRTVTTEEDFHRDFDDLRQTLRVRQVTELIRLVDSAVELPPAMISCYYETNILANGYRLVAPYRSLMILRQAGSIWQTVFVANSFFMHFLSPNRE